MIIECKEESFFMSAISWICWRAKILDFIAAAFSNSLFFAEIFISRSRVFMSTLFLPLKKRIIFRIVLAYSCLGMAPTQVPGQR